VATAAALVDVVDVDVLAFFCFFLMSCSIQLSVAESPKSKIRRSAFGTTSNVAIYIYLKRTRAFQIATSCYHLFLLGSVVLGLINEELKNRFNIYVI
jgi:hypothetical protein